MATYKTPYARAARFVCAVFAITVAPTLTWQVLDARSSATVAAPVKAAAIGQETIVRKTMLTWGHTKSDRLVPAVRRVYRMSRNEAARNAAAPVLAAKADREAMVTAEPKADAGQFSDWLVPDEAGARAARIIDFAVRRSYSNRNSCRARHKAIVSAFSVRRARIMADRPVMFQSSICAANGEIVITCIGTNSTVSPRRIRPGSRCKKRG